MSGHSCQPIASGIESSAGASGPLADLISLRGGHELGAVCESHGPGALICSVAHHPPTCKDWQCHPFADDKWRVREAPVTYPRSHSRGSAQTQSEWLFPYQTLPGTWRFQQNKDLFLEDLQKRPGTTIACLGQVTSQKTTLSPQGFGKTRDPELPLAPGAWPSELTAEQRHRCLCLGGGSRAHPGLCLLC